MFRDRTKRVDVSEVQLETVMDLLHFLPTRLLQAIVVEYKLEPQGRSKDAMILVITEHRKTIFRSLKFTLSYANRTKCD